jgi:hypothetical protein
LEEGSFAAVLQKRLLIIKMPIKIDTFPRFAKQIISTLLLVAVPCVTSFSQIENLRSYGGIAKTFSNLMGDPVVLLRQGIFLDPLYDPADVDQGYADNLEFNRMLKPSLIYHGAPNNFSTAYSDILTKEQWALVPLLPNQVAERIKLRAVLYNSDGSPKAGYKRYLERKTAWENILVVYENTPPDQRTPDLEARYQQTQDDFELVRPQYQPTENVYIKLNEQASMEWREAAIRNLSKFSAISTAGQSYLLTGTSPSLSDLDRNNWLRTRNSVTQLRRTDPLPRLAANVDASVVPWWQWSDINDVDTNICSFGDADITIQFDIAVVKINRDWLNLEVFESQAWRWKSGSIDLLSDGRLENNQGISPLYPNSILLARSVTISGPGISPCIPYIRKAVRARHEVSFGPFKVAGTSSAGFYLPPVIAKNSTQIFYPQVLGYGVALLPKTPNSNPDFVWPDN